MMEAARTSETLVNFYQTTRRYSPEDSRIYLFGYSFIFIYLFINLFIYIFIYSFIYSLIFLNLFLIYSLFIYTFIYCLHIKLVLGLFIEGVDWRFF
jgi:hypothetical protein